MVLAATFFRIPPKAMVLSAPPRYATLVSDLSEEYQKETEQMMYCVRIEAIGYLPYLLSRMPT